MPYHTALSLIGMVLSFTTEDIDHRDIVLTCTRIGRKPVLIMAYAALTFSFATSPLYFHYFRDTNPYWILPGCFFQAVGGGIPVIFTTLYSIAADVTDEKNRSVASPEPAPAPPTSSTTD